MMPISAALSQNDRDAISSAITTIQKRLPFLVDLVSKDRATLPKMGNKTRSFVSNALEVANRNPDFLPRSFDVDEMRKDLELFHDLSGLLMSLTQLQDMVNDTCLLVGSEAYTAALTVYNYAKTSGVSTNGLEPIVDEMREHFRKPRKAKPVEVKE
jgi:hypothetical protein